jgi:hypothetical protein
MKQTIIGALGVALIALGASGIAWSDHDRDDDRPAYRGALTQSGGTGLDCPMNWTPTQFPADQHTATSCHITSEGICIHA